MASKFTHAAKVSGRTNMWKGVIWLDALSYVEVCDFFNQLQVPSALILHDKDSYDESELMNLEDSHLDKQSKLKKPHVHFILKFDGVKSVHDVERLLEPIEFSTNRYYEKCISPSACQRYMCHLDHPDKHQYRIDEVDTFCGFVYEPDKKLSPEARARMVPEVVKFIQEEQISSYAMLCNWVCFNRPELIPVVMKDYAYGIKSVCESVAKRKALNASSDSEAEATSY